MDLTLVIGIALGLLTGAVAGLTVLAPLTRTTVDDKALAIAVKVKQLAESLKK